MDPRLHASLDAARQRQAVARPSRPVCGWCCLLILASQEVAVIEGVAYHVGCGEAQQCKVSKARR